MSAQEGLLAGTVGRSASSYSHVWRVIKFRRLTKCIKIAFTALSCTLLLVPLVENWRSPVLRSPMYVHLNIRLSRCDYFQIRNTSEGRIREKKKNCFSYADSLIFFLRPYTYWETRWYVAYRNVRLFFLFLYCIKNYGYAKIYGESFIWNWK